MSWHAKAKKAAERRPKWFQPLKGPLQNNGTLPIAWGHNQAQLKSQRISKGVLADSFCDRFAHFTTALMSLRTNVSASLRPTPGLHHAAATTPVFGLAYQASPDMSQCSGPCVTNTIEGSRGPTSILLGLGGLLEASPPRGRGTCRVCCTEAQAFPLLRDECLQLDAQLQTEEIFPPPFGRLEVEPGLPDHVGVLARKKGAQIGLESGPCLSPLVSPASLEAHTPGPCRETSFSIHATAAVEGQLGPSCELSQDLNLLECVV